MMNLFLLCTFGIAVGGVKMGVGVKKNPLTFWISEDILPLKFFETEDCLLCTRAPGKPLFLFFLSVYSYLCLFVYIFVNVHGN